MAKLRSLVNEMYLVIFLLMLGLNVKAGGGASNGSFTGERARLLLQKSTQSLTKTLEQAVNNEISEEQYQLAVKVLQNLNERPDELGPKIEGKTLMFDYAPRFGEPVEPQVCLSTN